MQMFRHVFLFVMKEHLGFVGLDEKTTKFAASWFSHPTFCCPEGKQIPNSSNQPLAGKEQTALCFFPTRQKQFWQRQIMSQACRRRAEVTPPASPHFFNAGP
jgi:hypothetical protein